MYHQTSDEFLEELDNFKPEKCLFNVISLSINPKRLMDNDGYVKAPTISQAEKIAAISESLEHLLTQKWTPTATAMSLTLHIEVQKRLHNFFIIVEYRYKDVN